MMTSTWQFVKRYPYLVPFLVVLAALVVMDCAWRALIWLKSRFDGLMRASCCEYCPEDKWLCLVACDPVSRRLELVDRDIDREEKAEPQAHPCCGCVSYRYGCEEYCTRLIRWESAQ
jgi:hypothetical protein